MYVYKITNTVNGKCYVGATAGTVQARWLRHQCDARKQRGASHPLYQDMQAIGAERFVVTTLAEAATVEELATIERGFIASEGAVRPAGYNHKLGGNGLARVIGDGTRDKLTGLGARRQRSTAECTAMRDTKTSSGFRHKKETRERIAAANLKRGVVRLHDSVLLRAYLLRTQLGMAQFEVADVCGIDRLTVNRLVYDKNGYRTRLMARYGKEALSG